LKKKRKRKKKIMRGKAQRKKKLSEKRRKPLERSQSSGQQVGMGTPYLVARPCHHMEKKGGEKIIKAQSIAKRHGGIVLGGTIVPF